LVKDQKITFSATLLFDHDQSALKPEAGNVLQDLVAALQQNPSVQLEIGGHTDQTGARAYNQQLSEKRAAAVRDYLVAKGIRQDRLRVKGYGADQPVGDQQTPEGRAANRRVECIVL
jgi:outer membrane protein OmpA-like peptidoglycan-associated protein